MLKVFICIHFPVLVTSVHPKYSKLFDSAAVRLDRTEQKGPLGEKQRKQSDLSDWFDS